MEPPVRPVEAVGIILVRDRLRDMEVVGHLKGAEGRVSGLVVRRRGGGGDLIILKALEQRQTTRRSEAYACHPIY